MSVESSDIHYEVATVYDPDMLYFKLEDGVYVKAELENEYEFAAGTYYINATRVRLYFPEKPELSLMHLILQKAPDWKIGHVSRSLRFQERTFQVDRESIYDFIINQLCPTFKCFAVFDTINNEINLYAEDELDETTDYDTDIYISFDNLANEMKIDYDADDIKTVLKVTGDEDIDIRSVNMGSSQLVDLSWFHTRERMGDELYERYSDYLAYCKSQEGRYQELWSEYEALYKEKLLLENKVPVGDAIVKVRDKFTKLYCIYRALMSDDMGDDMIDESINTSLTALKSKLKMYHITEETNNRTDSILMTLRGEDNLSATFRICHENADYIIRLVITDADAGETKTLDYSLRDWVTGKLSTSELLSFLEGYTVSYIGTLGAFFCIAKDETKQATLSEYGLGLLQAERKKYTAVQSVQVSGGLAETSISFTENDFTRMMALEPPSSPVNGTLWLDRAEEPSTIKAYKNGSWIVPQSSSDIKYEPTDYENFVRYLDNLVKLQCIKEEIAKKEQDIKALDIQLIVNEKRRVDITTSCEMVNYFTKDEYIRLSYFLREDEYNDTAFVITEYTPDAEAQEIRNELRNAGQVELNKLCKPQLSFNADLSNLLAIPEFEPLLDQFRLGNFIHVAFREDFHKVVRLLQVDIDFYDLSNFSCTFGDMLRSKSQADIHADLLSQAATMAKSVASNSSSWQKAAMQASDIDNRISEGLIDADTSLSSNAIDQAISWDATGIHLRKYKDESKTEFEDIQGWITNSGLFYSDDGFKSSKSLYGKFTYKGETYFGSISDAVIGGIISGTVIEGGSIDIGNGNFVVEADGTVSMKSANIENYVNSSEFADVTGKMMYRTEVLTQGPTIFTDIDQRTTLRCIVYSWDEDITQTLDASKFTWRYSNGDSGEDIIYATGVKQITIDSSKFQHNSCFYCEVDI